MDYFLVYHRAKQRAILRNGSMDHFTVIDRTPFEKVHLICCKHLLGTKNTSSNIGVKAELAHSHLSKVLGNVKKTIFYQKIIVKSFLDRF
jgi:hypothetical protein